MVKRKTNKTKKKILKNIFGNAVLALFVLLSFLPFWFVFFYKFIPENTLKFSGSETFIAIFMLAVIVSAIILFGVLLRNKIIKGEFKMYSIKL